MLKRERKSQHSDDLGVSVDDRITRSEVSWLQRYENEDQFTGAIETSKVLDPKERPEAATDGKKGKIETLLQQTAIPGKFRLKVADISFAYKN